MTEKMNSNKTQNETQSKKSRKSDWTTLHVPTEVVDTLKRIKARSKEDKANWKIITEALSYYSSIISSPRKLMNIEKTDKVAWYTMKVVMTFGKFLDNPSEENYNNLQIRLNEIKQRLNVEIETVQKLAEQYLKIKKEDEKAKTRVSLVQAMKMLIVLMMTEACSTEGESD